MKWVSTLNNKTRFGHDGRVSVIMNIQQYKKTGRVIRQQQNINGFAGIYIQEDGALLEAIDPLHDTPSGPMI
ncbi:MAG: hypothetical protein ACI8VC_002821 [Candidatus Endobugula sp.]|jgi:hypothetical protein